MNGSGCPLCAGQKVLKYFNDLNTLNPELAKQWHPIKNGNLKPENVTVSSNKKVWWLGICKHEWEAIVNDRTGKHKSGCPECGYLQRAKSQTNSTLKYHWKTGEELVCQAGWEPKVIDYWNTNKIDFDWQITLILHF